MSVKPCHEISDHYLVTAVIDHPLPSLPSRSFTWRSLKKVNFTALDKTLLSSTLLSSTTRMSHDVDEYYKEGQHLVVSELDKVAPVKACHRTVRPSPCDAFLSSEAIAAKRNRRRLERLWLRTDDPGVRRQYRAACRMTNRLINDSRTQLLSSRLKCASHGRPKWRELTKLLHMRSPASEGPKVKSAPSFPSDFSQFLSDKVTQLKQKCSSFLRDSTCIPTVPSTDTPHTGMPLTDFTPVSPAEVFHILKSTELKSSPVDAFPSRVIKACPHSFSALSPISPTFPSHMVTSLLLSKLLKSLHFSRSLILILATLPTIDQSPTFQPYPRFLNASLLHDYHHTCSPHPTSTHSSQPTENSIPRKLH